jgi:hypothetical protein
MKTKIIEMYRPSQYKSWEEANHMGGVYTVAVPEGTSDTTVRDLIIVTNDCMGGDDRLMWRFKPVEPEFSAFQRAFIEAYKIEVGNVYPEQIEECLRSEGRCPEGMTSMEYNRLHEYYRMFFQGSLYDGEFPCGM